MTVPITKIVLLGSGYVSVWTYRSLVKHMRSQIANGQVSITVICAYDHHCYHGWTAESLTDIIQVENRLSPLAEIMPKAHWIPGQADELDRVAKVVYVRTQTGERQPVPYDHLVVGIGSFDSEAVEGIRECGYQIKSPEAFQRTRQRLHQLVEQAAQSDIVTAHQLLRFTVAGGGLTGVELVTNLAEWLHFQMKSYATLHTIKPQIRLVNRSSRVLSLLQPDFKTLIQYTEMTMVQYGIEVLNNRQLARVTAMGAYLRDGSFLESSLVISTVGQSRFVLAGTESLPRDGMQRLCTNTYLNVADLPTIWGGGDACHVPRVKTGEACPTNALWAIEHGKRIGRNIARTLKGKPLKPFTFKGLGQTASLGLGKGISDLYGIPFTGALAWILRWFFFHYYMPSRRLMVNTIGDWFHLLIRGQRKGSPTQQPSNCLGLEIYQPTALTLDSEVVN